MDFYALAFSAYALANEGADASAIIKQMQAPKYIQHFTGSRSTSRRGESAAYAGHLLLAQASTSDDGLPLALELAHNVRHAQLLPSYLKHPRRLWPADNEVALAALRVFARKHPDVPEVAHAADRLAATLDALGLFAVSEVDPVTHATKPARGCALGLSVMMRALHEPEHAAAMYTRFREEMWQSLGVVVGFREYRGDGPEDSDSGPIVMGFGTSASAFGLAAARQVHADDDYAALARSAQLGMLVAMSDKERASPLVRSILRYVASIPAPTN